MQQPARWVDKLAKWLPFHEDQHYLKLSAAMHGQYKQQFEPPAEDVPTIEGISARLGRARDRAASAIRNYRRGR
jgi:hypothetical protein